jgi:hypothetical protein
MAVAVPSRRSLFYSNFGGRDGTATFRGRVVPATFKGRVVPATILGVFSGIFKTTHGS